MSVVDKLDAARHSLAGSNLGKVACKATSREVMGPKRKHIDYLIQSTNSDNVSIPNLGDILFDRCTNSSWVVVYKALCTFHHLMSYGNERFIQYMASRTTNFKSLLNFLDKSGVQGYDMSTFVRRHAHYLNEKASTYREMGYDFCRLKRGKEEGVLRTMDSTKLLKALPALQQQIDALLQVDVKSTELMNGVINSAFVLLFKDLIRLFACYNDGIINLLEGYFDMNKKDCKVSLDIYKKFLTRMDQVSAFMKVAEDVGFDKDDIPDLSKAPNSLLDALENHLQSLEKGKTTGAPASTKPLTIPTIAVPSLASDAFSAGGFATKFEDESTDSGKKDDLIEEEEKYLEAFKKAKEASQPVSSIQAQIFQPQPKPTPQAQAQQPAWEPLTQPAQAPAASKSSDDLLQLNAMFSAPAQPPPPQQMPAFSSGPGFSSSQPFPAAQPFGQATAPAGFGATQAGPWSSTSPSTGFDSSPASNPFGGSQEADFDAVFGGPSALPEQAPTGDILMPTVADKSQQHLISKPPGAEQDKLPRGLDASLQKMAKSLDSLSFNGNVKSGSSGKPQHQWTPQQPQVKTGGANWQAPRPTSTSLQQPSWTAPGQTSPTMMPQAPGFRPAYGQPPLAQGPYMGQPGMFPQQPGYRAPVPAFQQPRPQMPADPFGMPPGTQARF